jgi:hypothetical protein
MEKITNFAFVGNANLTSSYMFSAASCVSKFPFAFFIQLKQRSPAAYHCP